MKSWGCLRRLHCRQDLSFPALLPPSLQLPPCQGEVKPPPFQTALRKHIPGCVCQPCMHTSGMNRQSFMPHSPWGVHLLADVLSPWDISLREGLLKNKQTLSYQKEKNNICSNATIHMEISACSRGNKENCCCLWFPLSQVAAWTAQTQEKSAQELAVQRGLEQQPHQGSLQSPPHSTNQPHSLVSPHWDHLYGASVLCQISFFPDDLQVWENLTKPSQTHQQ